MNSMRTYITDMIRLLSASPKTVWRTAFNNAEHLRNGYGSLAFHSGWRSVPRLLLLAVVWILITMMDIVRYDTDVHEDMDEVLQEMFCNRDS